MSSKLLSLLLIILFINAGVAQEKNKFNPYSQPKKWKKEEERLQKAREAAKATKKIWELDYGEYINYESDGFSAHFTSDASTRKPKNFIALVSNRTGNTWTPDELVFEYRGACGQQIVVNSVQVMYTNKHLKKYFETENLNDAPIKGMLNAIVKGLSDQCDGLESVRVKMGPIYFPREGSEQRKVTLLANMSKANGWKLTEGFGEASADLKIKLRVPPSIVSKLVVQYDGACNKVQELNIAPVFSNNTERYSYKKEKTLSGYEEIAERAVKQYLLECPTVEEFVFKLNYVPESYFIREGKEGVIRATKKDNWTIDMSEFGHFRSEGPRINDYEDVLTLLEKKDFKFIDRYADFFKLFYEDFMDVYGTVCHKNLKNPTKISIYAFESRYNSEGYKISETSMGPPQVSYVETAYLKRYQNYSHYNKGTVLYNIFKSFFSGSHQSGVDAILFRIRGSQMIRKYINNNCDGQELKEVYEYMQELAKTLK